jgi:hypothetical protein
MHLPLPAAHEKPAAAGAGRAQLFDDAGIMTREAASCHEQK